MFIKGFIHSTEEDAIFASVHIVNDIRHSGGQYIGYMDLSDGEVVKVKRHESGCYNGQIMTEAETFGV